ncbi:hypothetical protein ACFFQF_24220 [Haladaptatus pallidirubidus]|uniref:Uncharacterized protein n=1 Tax=Haladaptatus pallidirubidus TaxID=1008152 RepID=A0AAV3UIQ3_9EURY|nr:hypothetical protein [Haladaptatus pallidirubidus]
MAYYLIRAPPDAGLPPEQHNQLSDGELEPPRLSGPALTVALRGTRFDAETGNAVWEKENYCRPLLAQEHNAVLDNFDAIRVKQISRGDGWKEIKVLPSLWAHSHPS